MKKIGHYDIIKDCHKAQPASNLASVTVITSIHNNSTKQSQHFFQHKLFEDFGLDLPQYCSGPLIIFKKNILRHICSMTMFEMHTAP